MSVLVLVLQLLVGNKSDLSASRVVTFEQGKVRCPFGVSLLGLLPYMCTCLGQEFADARGMTFYETSAKGNYNVEEAFTALAMEIKSKCDLLTFVVPYFTQQLASDALEPTH